MHHGNANRDLAAGGHELVRDVGVTTLMSIHDVNLASEYCDHIVVLQGGRVQVAGAVETVLIPEVLEPVFGVRVERVAREGGRPLYWSQSCAHSIHCAWKTRFVN